MALLEILEFPDPRLRTKAKPVTTITGKLVQLADDMLEIMYAAPGIGLAASQINIHQRLVVLDISEAKDQSLVLFNPEIIEASGEIESDEGCLSVPGFSEPVIRSSLIQLKAINRDGNEFTLEAEDILAVCIQHELDHLEGRLFVDYLSSTKRQHIRKKMLKSQNQRA
jgi:peptide deformylase